MFSAGATNPESKAKHADKGFLLIFEERGNGKPDAGERKRIESKSDVQRCDRSMQRQDEPLSAGL